MNRRLALLSGTLLAVFGGYLATRSSAVVSAAGATAPSIAGARGRAPKPAAAGSSFGFDGGAVTTSPLTAGYEDAGFINIGGRSASFLKDGDLCLGTSSATQCTGGPEIIWNPNNMFVGNNTSGFSLRFLGSTISANNGGGVTAGTQRNLLTSQGANMQIVQHGRAAMTAGALAVTFTDAFSAVPDCRCTHEGTSINCGISVAPTVNGVTFAVTGGSTDFVDWECTGDR